MRRHTAGIALKCVGFHSAAAATNDAASADENTMVVCVCHACNASVHAPMWNSGYMHNMTPRGSSCEPGCVRR